MAAMSELFLVARNTQLESAATSSLSIQHVAQTSCRLTPHCDVMQLAAVMHAGNDSSDASSPSEGAYVPAGFGAFCVPHKTHDVHLYALAESVMSPSDGASASHSCC